MKQRKPGDHARVAAAKLGMPSQEGGRADRKDFLVEEPDRDRVRPVRRMPEADRHVDQRVVIGAVIRGGDQPHVAIRHLGTQRAKARHQPEIGDVVGAGDGDRRVGACAEIVQHVADMAETDADRVGELLPVWRHREVPAGAREQLDAEIALEIGDVPTDRRLSDTELARRRGEAAETGRYLEHRERIQKRKVLAEAHQGSTRLSMVVGGR